MIGAATGIGLILTLIQLYQREGDKRSAQSRDDFFKWLIEHNFRDIKTQIQSQFDLSTEIEKLLHMNQEQLLERLNDVDSKLLCIMNSVLEFRGFIHAIDPKAGLSEQEENILIQAVESGGARLIDNSTMNEPNDWAIGSHHIEVKRQSIIECSLKKLARLDFLEECFSSKGNIYYQLTELAFDYVDNIKKSDLSDQAKSILKQYVDSGVDYLCTILNGMGQVQVYAQNEQIDIDSPRFAKADLDSLEDHGLIRFDGDMGTGGKRYTLTRDGAGFIKS